MSYPVVHRVPERSITDSLKSVWLLSAFRMEILKSDQAAALPSPKTAIFKGIQAWCSDSSSHMTVCTPDGSMADFFVCHGTKVLPYNPHITQHVTVDALFIVDVTGPDGGLQEQWEATVVHCIGVSRVGCKLCVIAPNNDTVNVFKTITRRSSAVCMKEMLQIGDEHMALFYNVTKESRLLSTPTKQRMKQV